MQKKYFPLLILVGFWSLRLSAFSPPENIKQAYTYYIKGNINYSEGRFYVAERQLEKAYRLLPDNFNVRLSYALAKARNGHLSKSVEVIKETKQLLGHKDTTFAQKVILADYTLALSYIFNEKYSQSWPLLKKCIRAQEKIPNSEYQSLFLNTAGYVAVMNQGIGSHKKGNLPAHRHLHERDLIQAFMLFEKALDIQDDNGTAFKNAKILSDTLHYLKNIEFDAEYRQEKKDRIKYISLEEQIFQQIPLSFYDECAFLLDISGSMVQEKVACAGETRFEVMKQSVMHLLKKINPEVQVGIGTIGGDCGKDPRLWIKTGEESRKELISIVNFLVPDGTTPLLDMLRVSMQLFHQNHETDSKVLFLVSDGANICRAPDLDICQWAVNAAKAGLQIHILTFLDATFNNTNAFAEYACLTEATGGNIFYIDNNYCGLKDFSFTMMFEFQPEIPKMERVQCWGKSVERLWAVYE